MKSRDDIKLEGRVSNMILTLVREAIYGKLDDMPNNDLQGTCEALAMDIISVVRGK